VPSAHAGGDCSNFTVKSIESESNFGAVLRSLVQVEEHEPRLLVVAARRILDLVLEQRRGHVGMIGRVKQRRFLGGGQRGRMVFLRAHAARGARGRGRAHVACGWRAGSGSGHGRAPFSRSGLHRAGVGEAVVDDVVLQHRHAPATTMGS